MIVLALIITVLFMNGNAFGIETVVDEDAEQSSSTAYFTANDLNGSWSTDGACRIVLSGTDASITGNGAYYNDGSITIKNGGKYVISGELDDGSIIVDAYNSSKVWIMLDGVTINCEDDACIIVDQADKVFLTLAEGTDNTLTSGSSYSDEALADNTGGAIFSHDDLTINGSGTLTITTSYKHGIDANDSLVIAGGTISITCPQDGIHANDPVHITGADVTIAAGDDAIHSDTAFYMADGTILITECTEGIEALTIDVDGGDITIYATDDGMNANGGSDSNMFGGKGGMNGGMGHMGGMDGGFDSADTSAAEDASGMPAAPDQEDASDQTGMADAEDASGMPAAADQKMEESSVSGTDKSQDADTAEIAETEESYIRINGGNITIINTTGRDADGLDSNGSIYIEGGTVLISLLGSNGNCALDCATESGGSLVVNGGTLVACGDSSMAESFSDSSTQCAVLYNMDTTAEAGTELTLQDTSGNVILSYTPVTSYNSVAMSCADMTAGETYTFTAGETTEEFTISSTAMTVGNASGMGGMMGGMMGGSMGTQSGTADNSGGFQKGHRGSGRRRFDNSSEGTGDSTDDGSTDESMPPMMPGDGSTDENAPQMENGEGGGQGGHFGDNTVGPNTQDDDAQEDAQQSVSTAKDVRELSSDVWKWMASAGVVLIAGLAAAFLFRKN